MHGSRGSKPNPKNKRDSSRKKGGGTGYRRTKGSIEKTSAWQLAGAEEASEFPTPNGGQTILMIHRVPVSSYGIQTDEQSRRHPTTRFHQDSEEKDVMADDESSDCPSFFPTLHPKGVRIYPTAYTSCEMRTTPSTRGNERMKRPRGRHVMP
ncbi:uncharacterized protein PV06_05074 [Exophiala oligosperma]|uniref:Uncharacterized protein n=1 Tax=Exophiala oligosperma TaxID=215243 RepID=A0A0D2C2Q6_9EURO|nr:uncharacterized protein PV06_05074 [Exophiala oligosperma]KIW44032.1 hypothetical protein PV06_05074 [Exophiala oligosperma]